MSDQQGNSNGNRKLWIGGGIAAAAAVVIVSQFSVDFPPTGDATSGTIAPAQRYRAAQPTAQDVQVGTQSGAQSGQPTQAGDSSTVNAGSANQASSNQASSNQGVANQAMKNISERTTILQSISTHSDLLQE